MVDIKRGEMLKSRVRTAAVFPSSKSVQGNLLYPFPFIVESCSLLASLLKSWNLAFFG